jgi:EEF1A lysine methyltransferase 4
MVTAPLPNLQPFLEKHLPPPSSTAPNVLHLGTGMSTLPSDLHQLGYPTQTAINFSSVCISTMSALHAFLDLPITWLTMDVCTMTFPANWVDIAVDKGALDAMHNDSLLDLANEVKANVKAYLDQVAKVLKPNGGKW